MFRTEADVQRHVALMPGYLRELLDAADWRYYRSRVAEYQSAHRPHTRADDDA